MNAPDSLPAALCTECGLCCDGSLLAEVELAGSTEADRLEALGFETEEGDDDGRDAWFLPLPCAALCGSRCSVYEHRPRTCRTFECRLLKDVAAGVVPLGEALETVAGARTERDEILRLLRALDPDGETEGLPLAERVSETVLRSEEGGKRGRRTDRLRERMKGLTALLGRHFLRG